MEINKFNKLIILVLLRKLNGKDTSYSIVRVITRRFCVMNFLEVIDELKECKLIEEIKENSVDYFILTELGKILINNELEEIIKYSYLTFPNQREFLNAIFDAQR